MPTNRTRKTRTSKSHIPDEPTKKYLSSLCLKAFLGNEELSDEETAICKKYQITIWKRTGHRVECLYRGETPYRPN